MYHYHSNYFHTVFTQTCGVYTLGLYLVIITPYLTGLKLEQMRYQQHKLMRVLHINGH